MSDAKRFKPTPFDAAMTNTGGDEKNQVGASASFGSQQQEPPSSRTHLGSIVNEDASTTESDVRNTVDKRLLKEIFQQKWPEEDDETLKHFLTIDGKPIESQEAEAINSSRDVLLQAVVAAFEQNRDMVVQAKSNNKTFAALGKTSMKFLKKQQEQERLKIENEKGLDRFLYGRCMDIFREYNEKIAQQDLSHERRKLNVDADDQVVNLFPESLRNHKDTNDVVDSFCIHLQRQIQEWQTSSVEYYAGYTVLFQSSGMGKTHLIFESLKSQVFGVYLCFRRSSDKNTSPPRSPVMDWLIEKEEDGANTTSHLESAALSKGTAESNKRSYYMSRFLTVMEATREVFCSWFNEWEKENHSTPTPEDWFNHQKGEETDFKHFQQELKKRAEQIWTEKRFVLNGEGFENSFVFFIDEGRTLIEENIFREVRRCFCKNSFSTRNTAFAVFTDTLSTLTNFALAKDIDPSTRGLAKDRGQLFPPFHFVNFLDIFDDSKTSGTTNEASMPLSVYGRPLWRVYELFLEKKGSPLPDNLLRFASLKLLRSEKGLDSLERDHKKAAAIACLACRVTLRIHPGRRLASELVGGHMAVCSHVYKDRQALLISYPSEPLLAMASTRALLGFAEGDFSGWNVALEQLGVAIQDADVDTGKIGEFIHRILLLLAIDRARGGEDKGVRAYDFLKVIVGDSIDRMIDTATKRDLETKYVWFNHFLPLYYVPNASAFQEIARRRAAVVCKPGQNGIDHEIPLMDETGQKVVGTLAIQTKNVTSKHDSDYPASASWKMSREFALHGSDRDGKSDTESDFYFAMYHNVGYQLADEAKSSFECRVMQAATDAYNWTVNDNKKECYAPTGLEIVGLDLPLFVSPEAHRTSLNTIQKMLKQLRNQGRNPTAHCGSKLKVKLRQLAPLSYHESY
mmetsp:Transcript_34311/g.83251  ORF Transcript_34311/g.83251 Transcript_34311/m.83251 type:complete len:910 (-) Transcript_34311:580-3309(-)